MYLDTVLRGNLARYLRTTPCARWRSVVSSAPSIASPVNPPPASMIRHEPRLQPVEATVLGMWTVGGSSAPSPDEDGLTSSSRMEPIIEKDFMCQLCPHTPRPGAKGEGRSLGELLSWR